MSDMLAGLCGAIAVALLAVWWRRRYDRSLPWAWTIVAGAVGGLVFAVAASLRR